MRQLSNWLDAYIEYTRETESAPIFHKWVGLSLLAAVLRKKTWFSLGRLKIFPNLYVVLVAEPGVARKSQAINYGVKLLNKIPGIVLSADATTPQALVHDLADEKDGAVVDTQLDTGEMLRHSSLTIVSKELETFFGQKNNNTQMLVLLTDLYDCQETPYRHRTKHSGSDTIPSPYLNMLAATTPESLASSLPSIAIGGGLTSRVMFVWADTPGPKQPEPMWTEELENLEMLLVRDLSIISQITGSYTFSDTCRPPWYAWYEAYESRNKQRICRDAAFNAWYSRKPDFIVKVAMLLTAAETSAKAIEWSTILKAIGFVEEIEQAMNRSFRAVGRSEVTADVDMVMRIIKEHKSITETALRLQVWRDIDAKKFANVIETVLKIGSVRRIFKSLKDGGIWYVWEGE